MTIWRMRIACRIPKVTNKLTICNTSFTLTTTVARTRLNVTYYEHCLSCFRTVL
jgi:hypothetical protein